MGRLLWDQADRTLLWAGSGYAYALRWAGQRPWNVSLDIGADGTSDWSAPGNLDSALLSELAGAVQGTLAASGGGPGLSAVRLRVSSDSAGLLGLRSLVVAYEWAQKVEMAPMLAAELASRPRSGSGAMELLVTATGGGLALSNLSVSYDDDLPPVAKAFPALSVDAASRQPSIVDLGRYFSDDHTAPADLVFTVRPGKTPAEVSVALVYSRYLVIDARHAGFRGQFSINLTATDSDGLSSSSGLQVTVVHSSEYRPPPPAYTYFLWVAGVVLAAVGMWIAVLYIRIRRGRQE
jgi:hypothetical protein